MVSQGAPAIQEDGVTPLFTVSTGDRIQHTSDLVADQPEIRIDLPDLMAKTVDCTYQRSICNDASQHQRFQEPRALSQVKYLSPVSKKLPTALHPWPTEEAPQNHRLIDRNNDLGLLHTSHPLPLQAGPSNP